MTFATFLTVSGQSTGSSKQGDAEQTVRRIEQEITDALSKGYASPIERYMADTYIYTDAEGNLINKAQNSDVRSGALKAPSVKLDDMRVQLYGDTAVVTWRMSVEPLTRART
jgi:hypothetical protein